MANFTTFVAIDEVKKLYRLYDNPEAAQYICDRLNEELKNTGCLTFADFKYYCGCWKRKWWEGTTPPAWAK